MTHIGVLNATKISILDDGSFTCEKKSSGGLTGQFTSLVISFQDQYNDSERI